MKYQAAAQAVKRFARTLADDPERKRFVAKLRSKLSMIEMPPHCRFHTSDDHADL